MAKVTRTLFKTTSGTSYILVDYIFEGQRVLSERRDVYTEDLKTQVGVLYIADGVSLQEAINNFDAIHNMSAEGLVGYTNYLKTSNENKRHEIKRLQEELAKDGALLAMAREAQED